MPFYFSNLILQLRTYVCIIVTNGVLFMMDYSKEPVNDYFLIDMKSFYASVECIERNLDPLTTELVVMSRC